MWWRLTKTIIVSWIIGVLCGAVLIKVLEQQDQASPPTVAADDQAKSPPSNAAPVSPDTHDR
jgi:hypothetical protein